MNIPQVVYLSVDRLLGRFPTFWAVMNNAAKDICIQIYLWMYAFVFLLPVEFLGHLVNVYLTL